MKLRFSADGIVNGKVEFQAGKVYEISNETGSADRWIKRGAQVVEDSEDLEKQSVTPPPANEVTDNTESQSAADLLDSVEDSIETPASEETVVKKDEKKENGKGKHNKAK